MPNLFPLFLPVTKKVSRLSAKHPLSVCIEKSELELPTKTDSWLDVNIESCSCSCVLSSTCWVDGLDICLCYHRSCCWIVHNSLTDCAAVLRGESPVGLSVNSNGCQTSRYSTSISCDIVLVLVVSGLVCWVNIAGCAEADAKLSANIETLVDVEIQTGKCLSEERVVRCIT